MYRFLKIKNHSSHKDTRLDFHPGVNVITPRPNDRNPNNIGKTAILRAHRLVTKNRPLGGRFFSDFAGEKGATEIELGLEGNVISLVKNISIGKDGTKKVRSSHYRLDDQEPSEAFKDKVPEHIEKILNLSELNVQEQHDLPFLIHSSPGEVARVFNQVTKLEDVDRWVSMLTTRINTGNQEIEILENQVEGKEEELRQYDDLPDIERDVQKAERIEKKISACAERLADVRCLAERFIRIEDKAEKWGRVLAIGDMVDKALVVLDEMGRKDDQISSVKKQARSVVLIDEQLKQYGKVAGAEQLVERARGLHSELKEKENVLRRVRRLSTRYMENDLETDECKDHREAIISEYIAVLKECGRCPTCFSPASEDVLRNIAEELWKQ